jgi:hypothetical protein
MEQEVTTHDIFLLKINKIEVTMIKTPTAIPTTI